MALIEERQKTLQANAQTLHAQLWYARNVYVCVYVGTQGNVSPLQTCGTFKKELAPTVFVRGRKQRAKDALDAMDLLS